MIYAGLDWSMSCPAICIYDSSKPFKFKSCSFYFYTDKKKYDASFGNVHGFKNSYFSNDTERFHNISEWGIQILTKNNVKKVCLEGYSMGSTGRIFNIAENIGILKHKLWVNKIEFITPAPTSVKKFFTGKGNANKEAMYKSALERGIDVDLEAMLSCSANNSPISDVIDSYALVDFMLNNIDSKV